MQISGVLVSFDLDVLMNILWRFHYRKKDLLKSVHLERLSATDPQILTEYMQDDQRALISCTIFLLPSCITSA
jgi:hypothetical protein